MQFLTRAFQLVVAVAAMTAVAPPLFAQERAAILEKQIALSRVDAAKDHLAAQSRFAEGWFQAGSLAIKDCDANKLEEALSALRETFSSVEEIEASLLVEKNYTKFMPFEVGESVRGSIDNYLSIATRRSCINILHTQRT